MNTPFISVILPVLNGSSTIQRAIDSVRSQTYGNWELILIDGGSTDRTIEILELNRSAKIICLTEKDNGNYEAINKGIVKARGTWVYILGADDYLWSDSSFENTIPSLETAYPDYSVAYGMVGYVNREGDILCFLGKGWTQTRRELFSRMAIPHQGVFHHVNLFKTHGLFDTSFRFAGDYELLLRELKRNPALFLDGHVIAAYTHGGASSLLQNSLAVIREYKKARLRNSLPVVTLNALADYMRTVLRIFVWRIFGTQKGAVIDDWFRYALKRPKIWTKV